MNENLVPIQRTTTPSKDGFDFGKKYGLKEVNGLISLDGKNFEGGYRIALLTLPTTEGDLYTFQRAIIMNPEGKSVHFDKVYDTESLVSLEDRLDHLLLRFKRACRMYEYLYTLTNAHCKDHINSKHKKS